MARTRYVDESTLQRGQSKLQKMMTKKRHRVRDAVFALGPDMDAAVDSGHTRTAVIESVAESLGVVKELIWRYDTQRRKPEGLTTTTSTPPAKSKAPLKKNRRKIA